MIDSGELVCSWEHGVRCVALCCVCGWWVVGGEWLEQWSNRNTARERHGFSTALQASLHACVLLIASCCCVGSYITQHVV